MAAFIAPSVLNDTIAVLVEESGEVVELGGADIVSGATFEDAWVIRGDRLNFQFYTNDGNPTANETGTLKITANLSIYSGGAIYSADNNLALIITSSSLIIGGNTDTQGPALPDAITISEPGRQVRISQRSDARECMTFDDLTIAGRTLITPECGDKYINITNSLTVNGQLQLRNDAVVNATASPVADDLSKAFIAVNDSQGIQSFGGKLRIDVENYTEPAFDAVNDADVHKGKKCFEVSGSGPIELDLEVVSAQYICINVSSIGASGTSTIHAGTVEFGSTVLEGNLLNRGAARTDFAALTLTGDLMIDGRWVNENSTTTKNPVLSAASNRIVTPAEYETAIASGGDLDGLLDTPIVAIDSVGLVNPMVIQSCAADRRPGVHLTSSSTIEGNVTFSNIQEQITSAYQSTVTEPARDEAGQYAVPCQSGLFLHDTGLTTIEGTVTAQELNANGSDAPRAGNELNTLGGYIYLGDNNAGSHNLVLEGDVDISGTKTVVDMASAAGASINACSSALDASGAGGNKLILSGSNHQTITFSTDIDASGTDPAIDRTLSLAALAIDKSGGIVTFETGAAGVSVGNLEPLSGVLETGNAASNGSLLDASVVTIIGGGGVLEVQGSESVYRTSPSEVVYAGDSHTVGAERGTAGTVTILSSGVVTMPKETVTNLNLYAGTLKVTEELAVSGTLDVGNTGELDLSGGVLKHTGALTYSGNIERSAGGAWSASAEKAEVTDKRHITINQTCGGTTVGLEVNLASGYTPVGGNLAVTRGVLDLNGGALVAEARASTEQDITVAKDGMVKDSGSGAGLMLGYVPAEKAAVPTTNVRLTENKTLPSIEAVGGSVQFHSNVKELTLPSLSVGGGSKTNVLIHANVSKLTVTDANVSSGTLNLSAVDKNVANHVQTGGNVILGGAGSYTVTETLSISGTGAHLAQGADVKVVVKGDVDVSSTGAGSGLGIPADPRAVWEFNSDALQTVASNAPLGHVVINSSGGVMLADDLKQHGFATLTLQSGQIHTADSAWVLLNPNIEADLAVRSAIPADASGTVKLGSRASFVTGRVSRTVSQGNSGSGDAKGGYLFPLGTVSETAGGRNRYRPLILNYSADVSPALTATASLSSDEVTWPATGIAESVSWRRYDGIGHVCADHLEG